MKKLCIFDLDGTLLDTIDDIADSMNRILKSYGYPTYSADWFKKKVGRGAKNLVMDALPPDKTIDDVTINEIFHNYRLDYSAHAMEKTKAYEGIPQLLKALTDRSVKMAVLSNKPDGITREMVANYFVDISFIDVSGEITGTPIKPDPHAAFALLKKAGVTQDEAVYVGDSEVDIQFAKNASIFSIGVLWGFRDKDTLVNNGANAIVSKADEILKFL